MKIVTVQTAKRHLSRLIEEVAAGEQVVIVRRKQPVGRLTAIEPRVRRRVFGAMRGRAKVDRRFFTPLPKEEIAAFEG